MKLSEALIQRADAQKRLAQLRQRINQNALIQEGARPSEDPKDLLAELARILVELGDLVKRINRTNAATGFDEKRTLTDALADRDMLHAEHSTLAGLAQAAVHTYNRYTKSEVKYLSTVNVADLQKRIDELARRIRDLDTRIQELNWQVELVD
jgi:cell fate (sporulation/competence/biofilm development) regulator YmcA (YheA/YmcA/DUF963 family)